MHDPLAHLPGYVLRRVSAAVRDDLSARLAPLDLRLSEMSVLMLIAANPDANQSDIGRAVAIKRANMAPLIARLEARRLITRVPIDGRSQGLRLLAAGEALLGEARGLIDAFETALLARVPAVHRAHLLPALTALWQASEGAVQG